MTAVPVPLVPGLDREEVTGALVLHLLGEAQQDPEVDVPNCGCVGRPGVGGSGQERGQGPEEALLRTGRPTRWKRGLILLFFSEKARQGLYPLAGHCVGEPQLRNNISPLLQNQSRNAESFHPGGGECKCVTWPGSSPPRRSAGRTSACAGRTLPPGWHTGLAPSQAGLGQEIALFYFTSSFKVLLHSLGEQLQCCWWHHSESLSPPPQATT